MRLLSGEEGCRRGGSRYRHHRAHPLRVGVTLALAATLVAGCGGGGSHPAPSSAASRPAPPVATPRFPRAPFAQRDPNVYPAPIRRAFISSCHRGGTSNDMCSCIFVTLRERYSAQGFVALFARAGAREPAPVAKAARECANS